MWTTTLYLLTTTLLLWTSAPKLHAQPEPPQRGDRYLPGELFHGKCSTFPTARYCRMELTPFGNECTGQMPGSGGITSINGDTNSTTYRFFATVPAFHKCPNITSAQITFKGYGMNYPCMAMIFGDNGPYSFLPMHPLDTMSMTYPISTHSIIDLKWNFNFIWYKTFQAQEFQFQIALNKDFIPQTKNDQTLNAALVMDTVITDNRITIPLLKTLTKNTIYYWRVRAKKNNQWQEWSAYTQFRTEYTPPSSLLEQTTTVINPTIANNTLTINDIAQAINKEKLTVTITSLHGVQQQITTNDIQFTTDDIIINIQHLPIGWYAVQLNDGLRIYTTSLIKR
ncbi:MAG: hypothetical protein ACK5C0_15450 [Candidatus Kapaibacterium sp.]|jgi:hypothetical protein